MKNGWKELVLAILLAWGMPWLIMAAAEVTLCREETEAAQTEPLNMLSTEETVKRQEETIYVWDGAGLIHMPLEDYLTGVLLCEMPASFHAQAKKAQAVVARTYALRRLDGSGKHPGVVCTDSNCCQGYLDPGTFADREAVRVARRVVEETEGQVLTYGGSLIDATYFSCSGGLTEDAVAVWGSDVPYLQSVASPGEEMADHFTDTVFFTKSQLESALGVTLKGEKYVSAVTYTQGGGVASVMIGGQLYRGTELRSLLGLRSTAFEMDVTADGITFTTKGYGHRVGMSQYGAQAMALQGSTYQQILAHYYQGTELIRWSNP